MGERLQINIEGAELVKFTNNAVFRLRHEPLVIRIAGSATMRDRVPKIINVAHWLAAQQLPAVRLAPGIPQPLDIDGQLVTIWDAVVETGDRPSGRDLVTLLRAFHNLPTPPFELPTWNPFHEIRQRIAEADGIDEDDLAFLNLRSDQIETDLATIEYVLPQGVIHGDVFTGNVLLASDGPRICDFDSVSVGPREWDLTPVAVGKLRFNYPGNTQDVVADGYGFDVTQWTGFEVLRQVRELKLVTSVLPILNSNPHIREQWRPRFDSFKRDDTAAKWVTYT
ncbi:aminoglycoside phosphotransferase family protein [Dactylosporangium sp. NPDC051485]|uniref:aminoglycoside phosphotransferase family protein n=1 Tax=Dactylosporangium sp. NPDC051485 TaxID=3154846 RepID=UPI0034220702